LVPVRNGANPEAPEGAHNSQAGTLFEPAVAPVTAEPFDLDCPGDDDAGVAGGAETAPLDPPAAEVPAGGTFDPAAAPDGGEIPGNVTAPYGFARPAPPVPEICAKAEPLSTTESSNTT
jgi:hypothetical protein